jgi:hypothetical protein
MIFQKKKKLGPLKQSHVTMGSKKQYHRMHVVYWSSNIYTSRVHHSSSQGEKSHSHLTRVTPTLLTQLIVDRIWDFSHNDNSSFWEGYTNKAFTTISLSLELLYELNLKGSNELEYTKRKIALSSKFVCFSLDWCIWKWELRSCIYRSSKKITVGEKFEFC